MLNNNVDVDTIPLKKDISNVALLPITSHNKGKAIFPITYPNPKIDCIVVLIGYLSQYNPFLYTAVKSLVILH